jgi:hypothetical protein
MPKSGANEPHGENELADSVLQAFLDEALSPEKMSDLEKRLRVDRQLAERLAHLIGMRDAGVHSIGEIWRRHRLSCPSRQQLGSYLLGAVMDSERSYIEFHIRTLECRYCQSNLDDLRQMQQESPSQVGSRRQKYFQSSAGHLRRGLN